LKKTVLFLGVLVLSLGAFHAPSALLVLFRHDVRWLPCVVGGGWTAKENSPQAGCEVCRKELWYGPFLVEDKGEAVI